MEKSQRVITGILICFFSFLLICFADENVKLSGKITDTDGEYIYVDFEKTEGVEKGMVFGVYDANKKPIAICEITRFHFEKSFLAFILIQIEDVKKGDNVFSNLDEEYRLREKIKKGKTEWEYFDFYKNFSVSSTYTGKDISPKTAEDFLFYQVITDALIFLKIDVYHLKHEKKEISLTLKQKEFVDNYRDIISESSTSKIDQAKKIILLEAKVNLGKLKYRLKHQGYSLKPKIIRLVFPLAPLSETIKIVRDKILENSIYVSREEENSQDVTNPVSCIIYTTPKIFANEINNFKFDDISIITTSVYGDTIELVAESK